MAMNRLDLTLFGLAGNDLIISCSDLRTDAKAEQARRFGAQKQPRRNCDPKPRITLSATAPIWVVLS